MSKQDSVTSTAFAETSLRGKVMRAVMSRSDRVRERKIKQWEGREREMIDRVRQNDTSGRLGDSQRAEWARVEKLSQENELKSRLRQIWTPWHWWKPANFSICTLCCTTMHVPSPRIPAERGSHTASPVNQMFYGLVHCLLLRHKDKAVTPGRWSHYICDAWVQNRLE